MVNGGQKIARTTGVVEFRANIERILQLVNDGHSIIKIYAMLKDEGRLTMSLLTLRYHYRKYKKADSNNNVATPSKTARPVAAVPAQVASPEKGKATRPENYDVKELF